MIRLHTDARGYGRTARLAAELAELIEDGYLVTTDPTADAHVLVVGPEAARLVAAARALAPNVVRVRPRRWTAEAKPATGRRRNANP